MKNLLIGILLFLVMIKAGINLEDTQLMFIFLCFALSLVFSTASADYKIGDKFEAFVSDKRFQIISIVIITSLATYGVVESKSAKIYYNLTEIKQDPNYQRMPEYVEQVLSDQLDGTEYSFQGFIKNVCEVYKVDYKLIVAQYLVESRMDNNAISPMGAVGVAQLMPCVYRKMYDINPKDLIQNIITGIRYHKELDNMFLSANGDTINKMKIVLAAYNAGPGTIQSFKTLNYRSIENRLPNETQQYVRKVLSIYNNLN